MSNSDKKGFTLVELIVVITILAILGTIAFISFQGYSQSARDTKRISDISNIRKSLEINYTEAWRYPKPDNFVAVNYNTDNAWNQWTIWEQVTTNLRSLIEKPLDPLLNKEYDYSVTNKQNEYELLSSYEIWLSQNNIINPTYAVDLNWFRIDGTYNWLYVETNNYYISTPSIMNAEANTWVLLLTSSNIKSQIVEWYDNQKQSWSLPEVTWWIELVLSVYTWSITENSSDEDKIDLINALKAAYVWSELEDEWIYKTVLETTSVDDLLIFVDSAIVKTPNVHVAIDPLLSCDNAWEIYDSNTRYTWCDSNDIIVCTWDDTWITISACNEWSSIAWTTSDSYGLFYQWWNNYWFASRWSITTTSTKQDASTYWPWNYYNAYPYILATDWSSVRNDNLWWNSWSNEDKQWTCASGYHIPSHDEWIDLVAAWLWGNDWNSMMEDIKLPKAWLRCNVGANIYWDNWNIWKYWSSSPAWSTSAYYLTLTTTISPSSTRARANGYSLRCFKN